MILYEVVLFRATILNSVYFVLFGGWLGVLDLL